MNRGTNYQRIRLLIAAIFVFFIIPAVSSAETAEFIFFHTSDIHGSIEPHADPTSKEENKPLIGGFSVLRKLIDDYRTDPANAGARIMYIDSGDFFQGTPIVDRTKGEVMVDLLNRMNLEATTIGNHEFDYSYPNLVKQMENRRFPVICCNVVEKANGRLVPFAEPYRIFTHNGFKIGMIGIASPETPSISVPKNVAEVDFLDPEPIVAKIAAKLRRNGVDFIILLSHLGYEGDLKFVEKVKGVDLIFGGHSHTLLSDFSRAGPWNIPIVHSGASLEHTSVVRLLLKKNSPAVLEMKSYPLYLEKIGNNLEMAMIEEDYLRDITKEMARIIGRSEVNLYRGVNGGDSPEGSFVADAMLEAVKADIAFINFGGLRQPILKGDLTVESAFMVQPFDNRIEILIMTGTQIKDLVERSVSNRFETMTEADKDYARTYFNIKADGLKRVVGPDYGYLYPSRIKFSFDPSREPMQRLLEINFLDGTPLEDDREYRVAVNDFIGAGGDGFGHLREISKREKTDILVRDALIQYIETLQQIKTLPEKRVINVKLVEESLD